MAYSSATIASGNEPPGPSAPLAVSPARLSIDAQSDVAEVKAALLQSLAAGSESPASIIHAATEFARILTQASGAALGMRVRGVVVCRARSGDIAPELGVALNADSGISGECMRAAAILVCHDAETDSRVDAEACRRLGIRSIVAVPLRGPAGIMGILEAFSTRPSAFENGHINTLRDLAEVIESASECEKRTPKAPPAQVKLIRRTLLPTRIVREEKLSNEIVEGKSSKRRYWIFAVGTPALLLVCGAIWLSLRDPIPESASEPPQPVKAEPAPAQTRSHTTFLKPEPGIVRATKERRAAEVLLSAAQIQPAGRHSAGGSPAEATESSPSSAVASPIPGPATTVGDDAPPTIEVSATDRNPLPGFAAQSGAMPTLGVEVSQGATPATLIREVPPTYPAQARMQRLAGTVTIDATISPSGVVREVKLISGPPLLAGAAGDAVRQWRYSPATLNGKAIEIEKRITVIFKLP